MQKGRLNDLVFVAWFVISPTKYTLLNKNNFHPSQIGSIYTELLQNQNVSCSWFKECFSIDSPKLYISPRIKSKGKKIYDRKTPWPGSNIWWRILTILLGFKSLKFPLTHVWMSLMYGTSILFSTLLSEFIVSLIVSQVSNQTETSHFAAMFVSSESLVVLVTSPSSPSTPTSYFLHRSLGTALSSLTLKCCSLPFRIPVPLPVSTSEFFLKTWICCPTSPCLIIPQVHSLTHSSQVKLGATLLNSKRTLCRPLV